jgi:hypothetical protein
MKKLKDYLLYLPLGFREQSFQVYMGVMISLVGVSYITGFGTSTVEQAIGNGGLRFWGISLIVSGTLLAIATVKEKIELEKFSLRLLSINILMYAGWIIVVAPFDKAFLTIVLSTALVLSCEVRIIKINTLFLTKKPPKAGDENG